jgi:hypothetical protein
MTWFQDQLYVGITRHKTQSQKERTGYELLTRQRGRADVADRASFLDHQGQIWRYDPAMDRWQKVFIAPIVRLPDGSQASREIGYRKMIVFQEAGARAPALFVTTISPLGSLILCSHDGQHFAPVNRPELGNAEANWSFRALIHFNGRLYTSPAGRVRGNRVEKNAAEHPVVYENANPTVSPWRRVSEIGFGDPANHTIYEMASFNGFLYAGTFNPERGFQIWKTDAAGNAYQWKRVITDGAFRGNLNEAATSMQVFANALFIGTGKQGIRATRATRGEWNSAELIRLHPDDKWDLCVGRPRRTLDGLKLPLDGLREGFGSPYNGVIWEMAEHEGWLYAATENSSSFLRFLKSFAGVGIAHRWPEAIDRIVEDEGGFDLWRSRDGIVWEPVTRHGFGNPDNWGVESMVSTPAGLFLGTVSMPRSGCEIWLGHRPASR